MIPDSFVVDGGGRGRSTSRSWDAVAKEEVAMAGVESRNFDSPDETRTPEKTTVELVNMAGGQIGRYTFQPGWRRPSASSR